MKNENDLQNFRFNNYGNDIILRFIYGCIAFDGIRQETLMFRTFAIGILFYAIMTDKYYLIILAWILWEAAGGFKITAALWFASIGNHIKNLK